MPSRLCIGLRRTSRCLKPYAVVVLFMVFNVAIITVTTNKKSENVRRITYTWEKENISLEHSLEKHQVCEEHYHNPNHYILNSTVTGICQKYMSMKRDYFRLRKSKVAEYKHQFVINGQGICDANTQVAILINSLHSHVDRRDAIRSTWGGAGVKNTWPNDVQITKTIKLVFVFGMNQDQRENVQIQKESHEYNDIIQGDFIESYKNMTLKSLLAHKWVMEYCSSVEFIIKSDDDMIVNIPAILKITSFTNMTNSIMGPLNTMGWVYRTGKWKLSHAEYPFRYYPPYESGSAYVISGDLISPLFKASEYVPHIFIDDAYITGILGNIIGIKHVKQEGFAFAMDRRPSMCEIANNVILAGTKIDANYLLQLWNGLKRYGRDCDVPLDKRLAK